MAKRKLTVEIIGDSSSLRKALGQSSKDVDKFAKVQESAAARVGKATKILTAGIGTGLVAGTGYAVKAAVGFEKQLSSLGAVANATSKEMKALRKSALKAGADTAYSAKEAAVAQTELAKGGLSVTTILKGGLSGALSLAAAGELELGEAASITANSLNLFKMRGSDATKVADAMATAANTTTADVADFGMALKQAGSVTKTAGYSFTDTMVGLEALAKAGIKNSDAGTSMKAAMLALIGPTDRQGELAKNLGLNFIDANGKMKDAASISAMLRDKLGGMGDAQRVATLKTLAGADGVRYLSSLYAAGPKKLGQYETALRKQGVAADVAKKKQDNLAGALEQLKGSAETLGIQIGSALLPPLSDAAKYLTDLVNIASSGGNPLKKLGGDLSGAFSSVDWSQVGQKIQGGMGAAFDFSGTMPGAISKGIKAAISQVNGRDLLGGLLRVVGEAMEAVFSPSFWAENWKSIFSVVTFVIPLGKILKVPGFGFLYNRISKPLFDTVKKAVSGLGKLGVKAFDGFTKGLGSAGPAIFTEAGLIVQLVVRRVGRLPGRLKALAKGAVGGVGSTLGKGAERVGEAVGSWAGKAASGLGKMAGRLRSRATGIVKAIVEVFHRWGARFVELGKNLIGGLISGITSKAKDVANAAKDAAKGAVDGVKGFLGIKSPSRVFHRIGEHLVQGFADGVSSSVNVARAGLKAGLLFPIEGAIADLQRERAALEAAWATSDKSAEHRGLRGGVSAARRGLSRAHRAPIEVDGSTGGSSSAGGRSGGGKVSGSSVVAILSNLARQAGLTVTSTTGGKHTKGSHHYKGQAVDAAGPADKMMAFAKMMRQRFGSKLAELFHDPLGGFKNGKSIGAIGGHGGHVHVAARSVAALAGKGAKKASKKPSGKLTPNQMRGYLYAAGFRGRDLDVAVAVGMAESGGKVRAKNRNSDGSVDRGFMQINSVHGAMSTMDPTKNARSAKKLHSRRGGFADWVAFNSGAHRKHMGNVGSGSGSLAGTGASRSDGISDRLGKIKEATGSLNDAKKALAEFNRETRRTDRLAIIDLKISGLEKLQAFKGLIGELGTTMKDVATEAAAAWRKTAEAAIDAGLKVKLAAIAAGPAAMELRGLLGDQSAESMKREDDSNTRTLEDAERNLAEIRDPKGELARATARLERAKAYGNPAFLADAQKQYDAAKRAEEDAVRAVEDAKFAIRETARGRRIDQLQGEVSAAETAATDEADAARGGLDQQEADLATSLTTQLGMLVGNLEARKGSYRDFVRDVKAILGPYGADFAGSPEQEATYAGTTLSGAEILASAGPLRVTAQGTYRRTASGRWMKIQNADGTPVKRATGGVIRPGTVYRVGELGPENISVAGDGRARVSQASDSAREGGGGAVVHFHGPVSMGSKMAAHQYAHKTAFNIASGRG